MDWLFISISSLEVDLRVPGNRDGLPFLLAEWTLPSYFPPFWTFPAKSSLVRKNISSHKGLNSVGLWHALCACSKLKFPIWKPRLGRASTIRSTRKFPYTPLLIFLPDIAYIYIFFHSNMLWYLYLHYSPLYNISIWPGLRCGLHYMSVCIAKPYVLLTTMGDWGRREEKRGILKRSAIFSALHRKTLTALYLHGMARFLIAVSNMKI